MNLQKFVYTFCIFIFIISCSGENLSNDTLAANDTETGFTEKEIKVLYRMRNQDNRVGIDEAMKLTEDIIGLLEEDNMLKSGTSRKVNSISALVSENKPVALKSGEYSEYNDIEIPDTLAYVLNFNDDLGFAIVSADTRIDDPILAFTGEGSLSDSTDNPGLAIFLERLEDYTLNSIIEAELQKDSLLDGIFGKLDVESNTKSVITVPRLLLYSTETISRIGPLVPVEWGQTLPFSNNLNNSKCTRSDNYAKNLTGCVAVATAQVMSYWGHPTQIGNYSFNWTELNKYKRGGNFPNPSTARSQVANLFEQIGKGVGMDYGCDASSADTKDALTFLGKHGFKVSTLKNYNSNDTFASLDKKQPLIARGCSNKTNHKFLGINIYSTYSGCHAWVIDGYLKRKSKFYVYNEQIDSNTGNKVSRRTFAYSFEIYSDYMHNNWGWNGNKNGYFASDVFNSNEKLLDSDTKSGENGYYQYEVKIAPYISK
jgi:hypothetical protein